MKDLALDLWHDLRQSRLLPVAVALGVALIAVPLLMLKGKPEAAPTPFGKQKSSSETTPVVNEDNSSLAGSSSLGLFDRRNPFRSLARLPDSAQSSADGTTAAPDAGPAGGADLDLGHGDFGVTSGDDPMPAGGGSGGGSAGSAPASGAASGGSGGGSSKPPATSGSDSGGSDSDGSSGGSDSGGGSGGPTPPPPEPQFFEYAAEVDFGRLGDERRYDDVRALDALPSERNPVIVYLGQTRANESAFLVNQALRQGGEGNCVPNGTSCSIVYLRPERTQDDHYFITEPPEGCKPGNCYHLKLLAVRRKLDGREASVRSRDESAEVRTRVVGPDSTRKVRRTAFDFRIPMIAGRRD